MMMTIIMMWCDDDDDDDDDNNNDDNDDNYDDNDDDDYNIYRSFLSTSYFSYSIFISFMCLIEAARNNWVTRIKADKDNKVK